jgi:diguanylate cyclase (GGDEF)-like protein
MTISFRALLARLFGFAEQRGLTRARLAVQVTGFAGIGLVVAALVALSLHSMGSTHDSLERLSQHLQGKLSAIGIMRENLYLRIVGSRNMLLMADPFEIDEAQQEFRHYAARIGVAYDQYQALLDANDEDERRLLEQFIGEAREGMPKLEAAIAQLMQGKHPREILPLLQSAFTTQQQALETLKILQQRLEQQSVQLAQDAVGHYDRTRLRILLLALVAGTLVLVIAALVTRDVVLSTRALERERLRYKALFEGGRDAVLILNNGVIVEWNLPALAWLDRDGRGSLTGLTLDDLSESSDAATTNRRGRVMLQHIIEQGGGHFEWVFRGADQKPFYGEVSVSLIPADGNYQVQLVIRDITARMLALQQMSHEASHDPLTGLANRREFERRLAQAQADVANTPDRQHIVCLLDLDKFKVVNDSAGHAAGDELLKQLAGLMKSQVRVSDLLARFGGDEFGLLLENCSIERAMIIVLNLIRAVEEHRFESGGRVFKVGVSVGMTALTAAYGSLEQLLADADAACYAAKNEGTRFKLARAANS